MNRRGKDGLEMMLVGIWLMITMLCLNAEVTEFYHIVIGVAGSILATIGYHMLDKEK